MSSTTNVLITGASRGIGTGLVAAYLGSPSTTVIAAVRSAVSAEPLKSLSVAAGSRLVIIEVNLASVETIKSGIASLETDHGIERLDIVVANAAMARESPPLIEATASDIQPFVDVNAFGQLELFKTVAPLLRKSKETHGKFIYVSSTAGSLTAMTNFVPISAYGASKALGNYLFKWLSLEQKDIIVWAQHPGVVATPAVQATIEALKAQGVDELAAQAISVEQSSQYILRLAKNATLESTHGKFFGPDGGELPW